MKGDPVRLTLAHVTLGISTLIGAIGASPCIAQTRVTSLEELRRELAAGDFITVVPTVGQPVAGRLMRLGDADLDLRVVNRRTPQERGPRDVTLPLDAIQSLERPRDSPRNGAAIGAGIGAGFGGAMFGYAFVVDRNEMDEWAPLYIRAAAVYAGIGALIGWAIDAANSKPHIRFDAFSGGRAKVSVQPVYSRGRGIALVVSFAR
jgi:HAMP domain-containing protein